jgi:eukaryotic-like serine/threonine-protein kinase
MNIGRYEVIETLARGGMGVVYKARDPLIDRVVAVKTLGFGLSPIEAEAFRKRFAREAMSAGRLNHPNIVTIHDMGESDDASYIAMEFLEGHSLREVLDSGVVLPPSRVAQIAVDVADGLAFAHRNDVVHCDIKPANIMVLANGGVKITDFGIARLPTGSRTFAGNVLGSPRYISPEQILGRPVDARSDVFSLGAVLYEMLTGVAPFAGESIDEILYQVINDKPQAPSERNRSLPVAFDAIVARAMAKDADDRYASASELASALRPLAERPEEASPLPPLPDARAGADPGATTIAIVPPPGYEARTPSGAPKRWLRYAVPAVLLAAALGWVWNVTHTIDTQRSQSTSGSASNTVALKQPIRTAPAVAAPIETKPPETAPPEPVPPVVANPVAEPVPATARAPSTNPSALARVGFAISPWGEVFVDGKKRGVTPPLSELKLPPGRYEIEVRNTTFAPHRESVELFADAPLRIRHKFQ